jgi:hypothetical protein
MLRPYIFTLLEIEAQEDLACAAAAEVGTACRRDLAEVAARDVEIEVIGIIGEIRMIEHIGETRTRLEMDAFGDRELLR